MFQNQLQDEPHISMIYTSDFDGQGIYRAAQNQNACFYDEGLSDFCGTITRQMLNKLLHDF